MVKLFCWQSVNPDDSNIYCNLHDICQIAGIRMNLEEMQQHFGIGHIDGQYVVQLDGIKYLSDKYQRVYMMLPSWVLSKFED